MIDTRSVDVLRRFRDLSLPKIEWTHEAHLRVCAASLADGSPATVLGELRSGIRRYNEATGVENTATSGYHETLTQYFVGTIADLLTDTEASIETILEADRCTTAAPLLHWSRPVLFSPDARLDWAEPDLLPLPWRLPA